MRKILAVPAILLGAVVLFPTFAAGQNPKPKATDPIVVPPATRPKTEAAPVTTVTVDGSEAMFTTMCALLASGYEADVSAANWSPMRAQLRDRLQHQQGAAVDVLRTFYKQHELADVGQMLSRYIWFGLV